MSYDRILAEVGYTSDKPNIFTSARNKVIRFDGSSEKYENWRNSLKKYFKSVKAKGDSRVKLISQFMTGRAEDLVDGFLNANPHASWGSLVSFLDKNYTQNRSTQDYLSELVDLKKLPNEGFEGFEGRIRDLYAKAFPNEPDGMHKERKLIHVFRNGVDGGIRSHLLEKRPKSFKEAIQMASEESEIAMTTEYVNSNSDSCQPEPVVREVNTIANKANNLGEGIEYVSKGVLSNESEGVRKTGRCKWFRAGSGWGFVVPDEKGPDVFVHQSVIKKDGFRSLADGERVEYLARQTDRGMQATFVCGPAGRNCRGRRRFTSQISQRNVICKNCGEFANRAVKYPPRRPIKACFSGNSNSHPNADGPPKIVSSDRKYIPGRGEHKPHRWVGRYFRERP